MRRLCRNTLINFAGTYNRAGKVRLWGHLPACIALPAPSCVRPLAELTRAARSMQARQLAVSEDARFLFHPSGSVIQVWPVSIRSARVMASLPRMSSCGATSLLGRHGTMHALPFHIDLQSKSSICRHVSLRHFCLRDAKSQRHLLTAITV